MAAGLKGTLYATNPDTGEVATFGPGTEKDALPDWVNVDDGAFEEADDEAQAVSGGVSGGVSSGAPDDGDGDSSAYSGMKKAQLQEEVDNRNADRDPDDQIQVGGNGTVKDLVAALEADDEAQA